ncbi:uncharacterized protein LOC106132269 [Amyelois transitella]|uniref:uncharacterized protein LOC106132269 n=1 Tax=Amyelois transitella TaxID=680683 RepID=UPI002990808F|nr:uncharacterized protein LOC106132269 [Amyelois transitella]
MRLVTLLCVFVCSVKIKASPLPKKIIIQQYYDNPAVKRYREYVQIDTSREDNLHYAVEFWRRQAQELGLAFTIHRPAGKPICVITWEGADPSLPSIMLNSHMDVVPAEPLSDWTYPPFSAHMDENGDIYGRGTQDDKDVAIQYLEAIRKLKNDNITLQRTLHVTLMPDEEIGGFNGMLPFINTTEFSTLNVGFALDEGLSTSDGNYVATYQDRRPWILKYTVYGEGGHGILMPEGSAMEKAQSLINVIMKFRDEQRRIMYTKEPLDYGAYNSININVINGGSVANVIPKSITIMVDIRLALTTDADELLALTEAWRMESGNRTELEFVRHVTKSAATKVGDDNVFWKAFREAITDMGSTVTPLVCPAATDMIPLRDRGIPCIGFSPKIHTTSRIHTTNEYLNVDTFLHGIDVYVAILNKLGNVLLVYESVNMMYGLLFMCVCVLGGVHAAEDYSNNESVQLLRQYVQINTTTGRDLSPAVQFWRSLAEKEGVPISEYEYEEGYPVLVLKWEGSDPSLNAIMLNSHMDVVPADESDGWSYPPFDAEITSDGDIYGRGTQDMKSISIQYFEALRRIKANNVTLLRTVYMTLMPDEEVGGESGMIPFLKTAEFAALNVGIEFDEGTPYPVPFIPVFYQDKSVWQIQVDCHGVAAHGSTFPPTNSTATGKCRNVMDVLLNYREEQYEISKTATVFDAGVYTSINLNKLNGGTANNIIPSHVSLTFDIRLGTRVVEKDFQQKLEAWISEAGDNVTLTYISKNKQSPATQIGLKNPYWNAITAAALSLKIIILPIVPPGSTDARHVRSAGVPAFGFSPMPNTPLLLHSVDEHLNAKTFLKGIDIYEKFITNLASIPETLTKADPSAYLYSTVE